MCNDGNEVENLPTRQKKICILENSLPQKRFWLSLIKLRCKPFGLALNRVFPLRKKEGFNLV